MTSFIILHSSFTTHHSSFTTHHLSLIIHHSPINTLHLLCYTLSCSVLNHPWVGQRVFFFVMSRPVPSLDRYHSTASRFCFGFGFVSVPFIIDAEH